MKRTVSVLLISALMASCVAASTGCGLSKPKVDGEYEAVLEITPLIDVALETMMDQAGIDCDVDDFSGEVSVRYLLELDDGEYTLTIDYESYIEEYRDYVLDNLEPAYEEYISDQLDLYGYDVDDFLADAGYSSLKEYCEMDLASSIDLAATDIENEVIEGDYEVKGSLNPYVELEDGTVLYYEKGDLVGYMDKDLVEDIEDADDLDELMDAFEDNDEESLITMVELCDSFGISADDFKDWLDTTGLSDDGLIYEAQ